MQQDMMIVTVFMSVDQRYYERVAAALFLAYSVEDPTNANKPSAWNHDIVTVHF